MQTIAEITVAVRDHVINDRRRFDGVSYKAASEHFSTLFRQTVSENTVKVAFKAANVRSTRQLFAAVKSAYLAHEKEWEPLAWVTITAKINKHLDSFLDPDRVRTIIENLRRSKVEPDWKTAHLDLCRILMYQLDNSEFSEIIRAHLISRCGVCPEDYEKSELT